MPQPGPSPATEALGSYCPPRSRSEVLSSFPPKAGPTAPRGLGPRVLRAQSSAYTAPLLNPPFTLKYSQTPKPGVRPLCPWKRAISPAQGHRHLPLPRSLALHHSCAYSPASANVPKDLHRRADTRCLESQWGRAGVLVQGETISPESMWGSARAATPSPVRQSFGSLPTESLTPPGRRGRV